MERLTGEMKTEIWDWLKEIQVVYLATVEGDRPRLRPVTMGYYEDKFWILTGTKDAKTAQIRSNPNIELLHDLVNDKGRGYIRFIGTATVMEQDMETKNRIATKFPFFKEFWETPEDPNCTLIATDIERLEYMRPGQMLAGCYLI
jgi:uncharacterized pyridoxamine 5'-phosphate oxidase family protein